MDAALFFWRLSSLQAFSFMKRIRFFICIFETLRFLEFLDKTFYVILFKRGEPFRRFSSFQGIRVPEPMRFEKAISTAICAILTRHAPAWLVRFACNRRSFLFSNFCEPNQEAFIGYGKAEDERRLAPSEDDNEARARKALDLAHCSRHPDARPLSADRENLVAGFPLTLSSRVRGCAPYHPRFIESLSVPRFMCGV